MKALEGGISGSFSTFPTGFNMTSSASLSILQQPVITEDCLKRLIKDDLQKDRTPRNLDTFYFFFSIYKLWAMKNNDYFRNKFLKDKLYFSTEEVVGDSGEVKSEDVLMFLSTSVLQNKFKVNSQTYKEYFDRYTTTFKKYVYKKECAKLEWTEEAHNFFMSLLEAFIQDKFIIPTNFKRQMNEYEMSSDVLAKIGGYQIQRAIEMQEKMDNCYDEAGQSKKVGHYNKPFKGRRRKNAQESK